MPLKEALAEVCRAAGLELELDAPGLQLAGVSPETPVTLSFKNDRLDSALPRLIARLERDELKGIYWKLQDKKVWVSSVAALNAKQAQAARDQERVYAGEKADDAFLANLKSLPNLREVDLEATKSITPAGLAHLAALPQLQTLKLFEVNRQGAGLGDEALRVLAGSKTLRDLSVTECGVTDAGVRYLEGMTQLTNLALAGNRITDAGLKPLAGLTNLQSLNLSGSASAYAGMQLTDSGLRQLSPLTELRQLSVSGLKLSGQGIAFPHLESLALSGEQVTDAALASIAECRELRHLSLSYTSVSDQGLKQLARLKELRSLSMDTRRITDAGIAFLKALPKLEHVTLRATRLSDESLRHLSQIKSLTRLDLHGSGEPGVNYGRLLTIQGLQQLKDLPDLRDLWISNFESPTGFLGLRELKQLRVITLFFTNIKEPEAELLEAAMPDTTISVLSGGIRTLEHQRPKRPPLPQASVFVHGRALSSLTGQPVTDCTLQFGSAVPGKPGEIAWGQALASPVVEVSGNEPGDPSRFWGESFRRGEVWARILAGGYQPELLTAKPVVAPIRLENLLVRLQPGRDLQGVVLDHEGKPAAGIRVYLADKPNFYLRDGRLVTGSGDAARSATTDVAGRFSLSGGNGTSQKIVAASPDGHLLAVAPKVAPGQEVKLTLPRPAGLAVRYDIPGDAAVAQLIINFETQQLEPALWKDISLGFDPTVTNHGELLLTNLTPGTYRLARRKILAVEGAERNRGRNERIAWLDESTLVLRAGQTQRVDLVRSTGQALGGEVKGITEAGALGAYLYVYAGSVQTSNTDRLNAEKPLDALTCGADGVFQTAQLQPGTYTIVALAFREPSVYSHNREPDCVGSAQVIVSDGAQAPPAVTIKLLPMRKP